MFARLFWICVLSIGYTYLGYPALAALLARLRPYRPARGVRPAAENRLPAVTLLIAAYNEEKVIASKLQNSLAIDYPADRLQILVAADGSDDRTPEIVRAFADRGVDLSYSPPRNGKMSAINRAMESACGEIVVFSDANNMYEPTTLRELVKEFADPSVGAVTGSKTIVRGDGGLGESEGLYWKYESFIREQETRLGSTTGVAGEVLAIRKTLFEAPPDNVINDDFYIAMRLIQRGYRVVYAPKARSIERVSASEQDEITRRTRIVAGRYQALAQAPRLISLRRPLVAWQLVSHKFLRPLVPFAMIGALLANLVLAFRSSSPTRAPLWSLSGRWGKLFLFLQSLFYLSAWLGAQTDGKGRISKILYLPTFLVNSNMAALYGLVRYLTGKQTARWQRVNRREDSNLEAAP